MTRRDRSTAPPVPFKHLVRSSFQMLSEELKEVAVAVETLAEVGVGAVDADAVETEIAGQHCLEQAQTLAQASLAVARVGAVLIAVAEARR